MVNNTYAGTGVDIDAAESAKRMMFDSMTTESPLVLNKPGAFASLVDGSFAGYRQPALVLKTEEPGSKQLLALRHGRIESICRDTVHHLLNDIAVMGARPLFVQDAIVCGRLEPEAAAAFVAAIAACCSEHGCVLTGGETSVQPGVLEPGVYMLTASAVGIVERASVIDGSRIREGDAVLALASNGLHTNGYSLVRSLLEEQPDLLRRELGGEPLLEALLRPHRSYYPLLRQWFGHPGVHGLAHITGGGIADNVRRIMPAGLDAAIELGRLRVPPLFRLLRDAGRLDERDMLRTFNMGAGLVAVLAPELADGWIAAMAASGCDCWRIGTIVPGGGSVSLLGQLDWRDEA